MAEFKAVVFSKPEDGELIHQDYFESYEGAYFDVKSFKQLNRAKYPEAVGSIYSFKYQRYVDYKNL